MAEATVLQDGPEDGTVLLLAHGAGLPMDSPFMTSLADGLASHGLRVVRFEFPYMASRRETGRRRPPDRAPVLIETWQSMIRQFSRPQPPFVGGKSMGGRFATMVADEAGVPGAICFGYPFFAAGKPDRPRIDHLISQQTPTLILQGERDPMGNRDRVLAYDLSPKVEISWATDGDHDLKPRRKSGATQPENLAAAIDAAAGFIKRIQGIAD